MYGVRRHAGWRFFIEHPESERGHQAEGRSQRRLFSLLLLLAPSVADIHAVLVRWMLRYGQVDVVLKLDGCSSQVWWML
jgi:hypothetical protein